jgi:hypothetical protein
MNEDLIAIHLLAHLMNYNVLAAKNYQKKCAKAVKDKPLFSHVWRLCKAVSAKQYKEIPEIMAKLSNQERLVPIAKAITAWHNKRMWDFVERGFQSISMDSLQKLGISGSLPDEIKARGYVVQEGFVYPKRHEKPSKPIDTVPHLEAIARTMAALESL